MYFVAVTRSNANPALFFEYLFQLVRIFQGYFGDEFDEDVVRNNMTLIYELLDETMDFGYPQNCSLDVLKLYINLGSLRVSFYFFKIIFIFLESFTRRKRCRTINITNYWSC